MLRRHRVSAMVGSVIRNKGRVRGIKGKLMAPTRRPDEGTFPVSCGYQEACRSVMRTHTLAV